MERLDHTLSELDPSQTYSFTLALLRAHPAYSHEILLLHPAKALLNNWTLLNVNVDLETIPKQDHDRLLYDHLIRETYAVTRLHITQIVQTLEIPPTAASPSSVSSTVGSPISRVTTNTSDRSRKLSGSSAKYSTSRSPGPSKPTQTIYYVAAVDQDHEVKLKPEHNDHCWAKTAELMALEMGKETRRIVDAAMKTVQEQDKDEAEEQRGRGQGRGRSRGRRRGRGEAGDGAGDSGESSSQRSGDT